MQLLINYLLLEIKKNLGGFYYAFVNIQARLIAGNLII